MKRRTVQFIITTLSLAGFLASASGSIVTFDTPAEFSSNFVSLTNPTRTLWTSDGLGGGYLTKSGNNATSVVYNINDNAPAAANQGAASFDEPRATFGGTTPVTISADIFTNSINSGVTFGIYTKVGSDQNSGYATLFRFSSNGNSTGNADVRFWDSNSNVAGAGVGTLASTQAFSTGTALSLNTWYTVKLTIQDIGTTVKFDAELWQGATQIGGTLTWTDSSSAVTGAGQFGARISSNADATALLVDNFGVVPEPSTFAMLGGMAALALVLVRRRYS